MWFLRSYIRIEAGWVPGKSMRMLGLKVLRNAPNGNLGCEPLSEFSTIRLGRVFLKYLKVCAR